MASAERYREDTGIATMIAPALPCSLVFLATWTLSLLARIGLGLPLGPGAGIRLGP